MTITWDENKSIGSMVINEGGVSRNITLYEGNAYLIGTNSCKADDGVDIEEVVFFFTSLDHAKKHEYIYKKIVGVFINKEVCKKSGELAWLFAEKCSNIGIKIMSGRNW